MQPIQKIIVLGGGSAGFLSAMTLKRKMPELEVLVIRSPEIGIIGVGEGTTTYVPEHLHGYLGIPVGEFMREAQPSWKLGVRFEWGPREEFYYPFTILVTRNETGLSKTTGFYAYDDFSYADITSALMHHGKAFVRDMHGAPVVVRNVAYHLENETFVKYLETVARRWGVQIVEDTIDHVVRTGDQVEKLVGQNGREYPADFFVDCSGFRSQLLGQELAEPFESYRSSLFCDRAVVGGWTRTTEPILPYTTSFTMSSGWMWQIEHEHRINRGYVYSSAFQSDESAEQEYRARNPLVKNTRVVKFVTGTYQRSWVGNVAAIGNAAGFVEPLEATALFVICAAAQALTAALYTSERQPEQQMQRYYNDYCSRIWRAIRRFLAVHYRFNTRLNTPFWQACRADVDLVDAAPIVEYYQEFGPDALWNPTMIDPVDTFRLDGYFVLLQGLKVPFRRPHVPLPAEQARWQELRREWQTMAQNGLTVAEALRIVRLPQWQWHAGFYG
jgi:tryptophan 7-halogenase